MICTPCRHGRASGTLPTYGFRDTRDALPLQAWGDITDGCWESGVQLIADGNADVTRALGLVMDCTPYRMGALRCFRFAAIIDDGVFTHVAVDVRALARRVGRITITRPQGMPWGTVWHGARDTTQGAAPRSGPAGPVCRPTI